MNQKKTAAQKGALTEIELTLKTDHTHAGKLYQAGDKIKVTTAQKDWLLANGVIAADVNKESK